VEVGRQDRVTQESGQGARVVRDPGLDVVEAVVAPGDDEEEPDGQNLARGERPLPVGRGGEGAVQRGRQVQALEGGPQDGQVGHDFHAEQPGFAGVHPAKLPTPTIPGNHPEHERTVSEMLVLGQLIYWFSLGKTGNLRAQVKRYRYFWVAKTYEELAAETGLSERQVRHAVSKLVRRSVLAKFVGLFGGRPSNYLRINTAIMREYLGPSCE